MTNYIVEIQGTNLKNANIINTISAAKKAIEEGRTVAIHREENSVNPLSHCFVTDSLLQFKYFLSKIS